MNAHVSATGLMQRFHRLSGLLVLSFCFIQQLAHAEPEADGRGGAEVKKGKRSVVLKTGANAHRGSAGAGFSLLTPSATPYALPADGGKQTVRVSVPMLGKIKPSATVYLRRHGDKKSIAMNDLGKEGDFLARDGIAGVNVQVDTSGMKPDSCLYYETYIKQGHAEVVSPPLRLCVSSLPIGTAKSNTEHPAVFQDGTEAVADEILLYATPRTSAATIRQLAGSINASVVGSILPLNIYQLRLPAPASPDQLSEIVAQLKARAGDVVVSVNMIGKGALNVNDPDFDRLPTDIDSQHGLKLVLEHNQATDANAWDAGGIGTGNGNGVTVVVLDTGIELAHPDFDTDWSCGCVANPCPPPGTCYDTAIGATPAGHGTQVAGIIAARTNNSLGVAGVAFGSNIHAIRMTGFTVLDMQNGFNTAAGYMGMNGNARIINASFSGQWTPNAIFGPSLQGLCTAINSAVLNGGVPRAVVVNAAGNNGADGNFYPARCNDSSSPYHATLTRKDLFITVSNSTSAVTSDCGNVAVDQRCAAAVPSNSNLLGSNYGAWVDIAAPGSKIRSTTINGGYTSAANITTGTSFSAPLVSGAAAILASCGVPVGNIEATLRSSANVNVPYPNSVSPAGQTPRLDIYLALKQSNHSPSAIGFSGSALNENIDTTNGIAIGTLSLSDVDTCDKHTFTIVNGAASFSIDPATNTLRLNQGVVLNYEAQPSYAVTVRVTDFFGATFDQALTVNINNVNEAPTSISLGASSLDENNAAGATVATLTATDPDSGASGFADPFTYTLVAGAGDTDNGSFTIAGNVLKISGVADFEAKPSYSIRVRVTDNGGQSFDAIKVINVNNVNEAPTSLSLSASSLDENNAAGATVATLTATDPDSGASGFAAPFTYTLSAGAGDTDNGSFTIAGNALKINGAADFEAKPSYSIRVRVTDNGGKSFDAIKVISVNNVNEAPTAVTLTPATASTPENGGSIKVADIAVSDDALGTNSLTVSDAVFQIIGNGLYFNGGADYETKSSYSVTVSVDDATINGTTPEASQAFTLSIADVNETPTAVTLTPATASSPENGGSIKVADIAVSDDVLGTNSLTVSDAAFQIIGNGLYFNGSADYETRSSYSVTVSVDDATINGTTPEASQAFTLSITDVNEAPASVTLTPASVSTPENGGSIKVADIAVSDDALGTNSLTVSDAAFLIIGSELHFKGNADYETRSSYSVTVSVDDATINGTTPEASQAFTLSITDVNEAPATVTLTPATASTPENGGSTKVADIAVTDDALGTNTLALSGTNAGDFQIIGGGLYFNGGADYESKNSYSVTVSVDDTSIGGTPDATRNFTLSITDVNETIPAPFLIYDHKEIGTDAFGNTVARYRFRVGNWNAYPSAMFVASPALPPCGLNTSASRTWVDFYRASDNSRIYGFCALGSPADLNQIWFGVIPANGVPPPAVYITLTDRQNNIVYKSNVVTIP